MATARDIISHALRLANAYVGGESPSAADMTDGLTDLNAMLNAWTLSGLNVDHSDVALADELRVPDSYVKAITYSLAVELAPQYGVDPAKILLIALDEQANVKAAQRRSRVVSNDLACINSVQAFGNTWPS